MKRKIPVYQYHDAWQILGMSYRDNGVVLDAASEEIMLRIEHAMSRLKVMSDDDSRYFWIWAQTKKRKREWLRVRTAHYKDFHYLTLGDGGYRMAILQNAEIDYSNNEQYREDLKAPLMALEQHVNAVVDWICEAPEEYNAYVERYLPYHKRSGDIPRKVLYGIDPGWHDSKDDERLIRGLEAVKASEPSKYNKITLRIYISIWSAAFRVVAKIRGKGSDDRYDKQRLHDAKTMTDVELFKRYDSKGRQIEGLDLDSEDAYEVWYGGNSAYHCMDVTYARIHLAPWRKEDTEPYRFHLYFGVYGYYDDVAEIAVALHEQGITLVVDEIDSILRILRQEDVVGFRPWPDKYMDRDGVTNQMRFPHIGDVTREIYWKIIKNTTWHKQKEAWPNE